MSQVVTAGEVESVVRLSKCADGAVGEECVCRGPGWCLDRWQVERSLMIVRSEQECRRGLAECRDKRVAVVPVERGWNKVVVVLVVVGIVLVVASAAYGAGYLTADLR